MEEKQDYNLEDVDRVVHRIEERTQSRPIYKYGALVLAVAVGSYLGAGRRVAKIGRDVSVIRQNVAAIGEFVSAESELCDVRRSLFEQFFGAKKAG